MKVDTKHLLGRIRRENDLLQAQCSCGEHLALAAASKNDLERLHDSHKLEVQYLER